MSPRRAVPLLLCLLAVGACADRCAGGGGGAGGWKYIPLPEASCGRGKNFGIGINENPGADRLLIFFLGGGACYHEPSCAPDCAQKRRLCAANLDGYGENELELDTATQKDIIFDRTSEANPYRRDSWIFLPYCTGDFHAGGQVAEYGINHRGYANVKAMLDHVVPRFPKIRHVTLYGISAGGYGVVFNYEQARAAFPPAVTIDLIDDSGPTFSRGWMPLQEEMRRTWGAIALTPPACAGCTEDWANYLPYLTQKYPDSRFYFLSYEDDPVIRGGFGGPIARTPDFQRALAELDRLENLRIFKLPGPGHVLAKEPLSTTKSGTTSLSRFLSAP